jgi:hypothetical protein
MAQSSNVAAALGFPARQCLLGNASFPREQRCGACGVAFLQPESRQSLTLEGKFFMEPTNTNVGNTGAAQTNSARNLSPGTRANQAQNQNANRGQTQGGTSLSGAQPQGAQPVSRNST